jgi:beta-lactamase class A
MMTPLMLNKRMMTKIFISSTLILLFVTSAFAQPENLRNKIEQIITTKKADIGVSFYGFENKDTLSINGNKHFPMQSVFKFHIALAALNEVDKGKLTLDQEIFIKKSDLLPATWSPLREDYPNGNVKLRLREVLSYTVSKSDNSGCDILLRLIGGTKTVQSYIDSIGIKDFSIRANEEEMAKEWNVQYFNWTTPLSSLQLLRKFYAGEVLSKTSRDFLRKLLIETSTGPHWIKGQLPKNTEVAHKTGTSDTNKQGLTAAVNDIGIVTLPNGKHFAICVFVSNTVENMKTNEKIIADITKMYWDYLTMNNEQ